MTINNREELFKHLGDIGVRFRESYIEAEDICYFDRYENGKAMAEHVDTWLLWYDDFSIDLGADYEDFGNDDTLDHWFSEYFVYPFDSSDFDNYLFDIETYRM